MQSNRRVKLLIIVVVLIAFPACWTYSLHPLADANDPHLIYDPALEGKWQSDDQNSLLLIISGDAKSLIYSLQFVKSSDTSCHCDPDDILDMRYEARLVQLGAGRFLDAVPRGDAQGMGSFPAHNIVKLLGTYESLSFISPSDDWLCNQTRLKLGECINGDFLMTAPSSVLQDFVQKHATDKEVFRERYASDVLHRVKEPSPDK